MNRKGITDEFDYRTVCLHILSGILQQATKMKTMDFANQVLFAPLGIAEHENIYAAIGNSGNVIYVNPEENINVAVSSYFKPTIFDRVDFIEDILLPCFR